MGLIIPDSDNEIVPVCSDMMITKRIGLFGKAHTRAVTKTKVFRKFKII